jgi:hypothetical protein
LTFSLGYMRQYMRQTRANGDCGSWETVHSRECVAQGAGKSVRAKLMQRLIIAGPEQMQRHHQTHFLGRLVGRCCLVLALPVYGIHLQKSTNKQMLERISRQVFHAQLSSMLWKGPTLPWQYKVSNNQEHQFTGKYSAFRMHSNYRQRWHAVYVVEGYVVSLRVSVRACVREPRHLSATTKRIISTIHTIDMYMKI